MSEFEDYQKLYKNNYYDQASNKSFWRGYWYYKNGNVKSWNKKSDFEYEGVVKSNSGREYTIILNLKKPKSSKCNCEFANGRNVICKHMIALYFSIFPSEVEVFDRQVEDYEKEQERKEKERQRRFDSLKKEVSSWSREELENYVANTMLSDYYYDGEEDIFEY